MYNGKLARRVLDKYAQMFKPQEEAKFETKVFQFFLSLANLTTH